MNPMEQSYPSEEPIRHFAITATQTPHGWYVTCPQWDYKNETSEAVDIHVCRIINEIKCHNELSNH